MPEPKQLQKPLSIARKTSLWLPAIAWAALILAATSAPGGKIPLFPIPHFDTIAHVGVYGVFGFLLHRAVFHGTRLGPLGWAWLAAFAIGQIYGILDEIHQLWIPDRFCEVSDGLADGFGVATGVLVYYLVFIRRREKSTK